MKYFGTDGFRGEANVDLNVVHAYKVGRFLGWYYGQEHKAKIVIGKDTRRSSYMFEDAFIVRIDSKWCRCVSASCYTNTKCILCGAYRAV